MATPRNPGSNPSDPSKATAKAVEVVRMPEDSAREPVGESRLSSEQQRALSRIVAGRSIKSVAHDVGVHRNTISHWLNHDPDFRAAYNAWRLELEQSARARIAGLTDAAVNVLRRALARDNEQVALALLKGQNLISPRRAGQLIPTKSYGMRISQRSIGGSPSGNPRLRSDTVATPSVAMTSIVTARQKNNSKPPAKPPHSPNRTKQKNNLPAMSVAARIR